MYGSVNISLVLLTPTSYIYFQKSIFIVKFLQKIVNKMFWGINLKPNCKYTHTISKAFHVSNASLDPKSTENKEPTRVFLVHDGQKYLICSLRKGTVEQCMLDLNFHSGESISFQNDGEGKVSLSGYLIEDGLDLENGDLDNYGGEAGDLREIIESKKKQKSGKNDSKNEVKENDADSDVDDSDDEDEDIDLGEDDDDDDEEDEDDGVSDDGEDSDAEESDDSDESDESEDEQPKAKQPKLDKGGKQQNGQLEKKAGVEKQAKKDKQQKKGQNASQGQQKSGGSQVLAGGVKIEDIRVGNGPEAKSGKRAQVYYEGRLKSNNKVFDSLKQGSGFKFPIGRGEVIKGWDVGVVGMKVGGKRRITCPPHMAYGARGSPPQIPPNSTLVFEVELKGVN